MKTQDADATDGSPRSLGDEKNDDIETMFEKRVQRFLSTHTLKFDLKGADIADSISNAGRALTEAGDYLGITEKDESADESRGKKSKWSKYQPKAVHWFRLSLIKTSIRSLSPV